MKNKLIVRYISIIFIIASFVGLLHHHNDLKQHSDCQICTIQHNVTDIDTPVEVIYIKLFSTLCEAILSKPNTPIKVTCSLSFSARAPPFYS